MKNLWLTSLCFSFMLLPTIGSQEAKPIQGISIDPIMEIQDEEELVTDVTSNQDPLDTAEPFIPLRDPVGTSSEDPFNNANLLDSINDEDDIDMDAIMQAYEAEILARANANIATLQNSGALDVVQFYMAYATNQLDDTGKDLMLTMIRNAEALVLENILPITTFMMRTPQSVAYANSYDIDILHMIVAMDAILQLSPQPASLTDLIEDPEFYMSEQQPFHTFLTLIETVARRLEHMDPHTMPVHLSGSPLAILLSLLDDIALHGQDSAHAARVIDSFFVGDNTDMQETIQEYIAILLPMAPHILPTMNANIADQRRNAFYQDALQTIDFLGLGDVTVDTLDSVMSNVVFERLMTHFISFSDSLDYSMNLLQSLYSYQMNRWMEFLMREISKSHFC